MTQPCKSCHSLDFTEENCERVCTNCGDVQEELSAGNNLCSLPDNEAVLDNFRNKNNEANQRLTNRIRGETNNADTRRQIGREKLMTDIRKTVKQLIKHASAVDETMDLVDSTLRAYKSRLLNSKKLGLVGACIYYVSAKHQLGISLNDISKMLNIKLKIISVCLKQVKQLCPNFEYERPNIKDLVKKCVDDLATKRYDLNALDVSSPIKGNQAFCNRLPKESQPLINMKDRIVLENRIMLLIDLFEAMHPFNQPTPQSLITAVVYHAWRSLDTFKLIAINLGSANQPSKSGLQAEDLPGETLDEHSIAQQAIKVKHKIGYEKFCQICSMKYSSNGYKIVSKLQASLLMLGKYLGNVNKINLPWYLKDIIENSSHLIQEHANRTETSDQPAVS